ncbi:MAG: thymidine phosphorylase, partial [Clostridia bacterium]|nr:thymidine phosphorylase [Clostridia bacterium]
MAFRMVDLIRKKRDGLPLTREEIRFFTEGYVNNEIPDYQASALLMAIWFRGMDRDEIAELTFAIRDSGEKIDFSDIKGVRADKHSTGGVGDKTSLVVAPVVASCGVKVAKISGRGLGHTGGTVDKLESIPGFRTDLSEREFMDVVNRTGIAIIGQSRDVAPADKKLYALRDVTSTVDSIPLIVSSIMGKKLAADDDVIVLDVKTGSGSFMKTEEESEKLAKLLVDTGKKAGKKVMALITDMDRPLGEYVGNALEVREAIETLKGRGPEDLREVSLALSGAILMLSGLAGTAEEGEKLACEAIASGAALRKLREMIEAQGGDPRVTEDGSLFGEAPVQKEIPAKKSGYIASMDTEAIGRASLLL